MMRVFLLLALSNVYYSPVESFCVPRRQAVATPGRSSSNVPLVDSAPPRTTLIHNRHHRNDSTRLSVTLPPVPDVVTQISTTLFQTHGHVPFLHALGINLALFALARSQLLSALTPAGYFHALALGTGLWTTLGWRGWLYCVLYLVSGQAVTKVQFARKQAAGLAEGRGGRRGPENVWGSAATGLLCAMLWRGVSGTKSSRIQPLLLLGYCASLATKLADTFASEIGKAYGKTTFLITTLQRTTPGTEGAVSVEGTVAAAIGGLWLSVWGKALGFLPTWSMVGVSTLAAFLATNVESYLGATIQEGKYVTNEVINFINTVIGAGLAMGAGKYLLHL